LTTNQPFRRPAVDFPGRIDPDQRSRSAGGSSFEQFPMRRTAMVHRIGKILARFPEDEEAVRKLIQERRGFESLCQEYSNTSRELGDVMKLKERDLAAEVDALRKRRTAVEEEILAAIEGYEPA
jgi:uncharacterized protein YdcH (DUF465 family)